MSETFDYRLVQVKSLNANTGSNFQGSTQFQWIVPQGTVMIPKECFLAARIRYDYTGTSPELAILPQNVGLSDNPMSCFWSTSETQMNNEVVSYLKDIPMVTTMERICNDEKPTNDTVKNGSPITMYDDTSIHKIYQTLAVGATQGVSGFWRPEALDYSGHYSANLARTGLRSGGVFPAGGGAANDAAAIEGTLVGRPPSGLFYCDDMIKGNTRILMTLNIDSNWKNNLFAGITGGPSVSSSPSSLKRGDIGWATAGGATSNQIRVEVTDLTLWIALKRTNSLIPKSVKEVYETYDLLSSLRNIDNQSLDHQLTLQPGCSFIAIGFVSSLRNSSDILNSPTNFRTQIQFLFNRLRVTYNGRPLMQPDYDFSPADYSTAVDGSVVEFLVQDGEEAALPAQPAAGVADSGLHHYRIFKNGKDWMRAYQEMTYQSKACYASSMYDFNSFLATPIFMFSLSREPGELGEDLLIHLDLSAAPNTTTFPSTMVVMSVQNRRIEVEYDSNGQPQSTTVSHVR